MPGRLTMGQGAFQSPPHSSQVRDRKRCECSWKIGPAPLSREICGGKEAGQIYPTDSIPRWVGFPTEIRLLIFFFFLIGPPVEEGLVSNSTGTVWKCFWCPIKGNFWSNCTQLPSLMPCPGKYIQRTQTLQKLLPKLRARLVIWWQCGPIRYHLLNLCPNFMYLLKILNYFPQLTRQSI